MMLALSACQRLLVSCMSSSLAHFWIIVGLLTSLAEVSQPMAARVRAAPLAQSSPWACSRQQVHGLFAGAEPARKQLRVAVAQFASNDPALHTEAMDQAKKLRDALENHILNSLKLSESGLSAENLRVYVLPCVITDHVHARHIGRAASAFAVFWGQLYGDSHAGTKQELTVNINGGNGNVSAPNSSNTKIFSQANINLPPPPEPQDKFQTSLTVMPLKGLHADSDSEIPVHGKSLRTLPIILKTRRVKGLWNCVLGIYALRASRHGLAVRFLDSCQAAAAGTEGLQSLYRQGGESRIIVGNTAKGLEDLKQAHRQCRLEDARCQAETLHRLGWAYERLHQLPLAFESYQHALDIAKGVNRWDEGAASNGIGRVYIAQGKLSLGQKKCEEAQMICQRSRARICEAESLMCLGDTAFAEGSLDVAERHYQQALGILRNELAIDRDARIMVNLGRIFTRQEKYKKAYLYLDKAYQNFEQAGDQRGLSDALGEQAELAKAQGNQQGADELYAKALEHAQAANDGQAMTALRANLGMLSSPALNQPTKQ